MHISWLKYGGEKHPRPGPHSSPEVAKKLEAPHCFGAEHPTPASISSKSVTQRLLSATAVARRRLKIDFICICSHSQILCLYSLWDLMKRIFSKELEYLFSILYDLVISLPFLAVSGSSTGLIF